MDRGSVSSMEELFRFLKHQDRRDFSPLVKRPGREADHPPRSLAEVKNIWSYISTTPNVFSLVLIEPQ